MPPYASNEQVHAFHAIDLFAGKKEARDAEVIVLHVNGLRQHCVSDRDGSVCKAARQWQVFCCFFGVVHCDILARRRAS